jgi:hypothetical protein
MHRLVVAVVLMVFVTPGITSAQFLLPGFDGSVRILMNPLHPRPGDTVTISLESSLADISRSAVSWNVDGRSIAGTQNTITLTAPALGAQTDVRAEITTTEGSLLTARTTITPTELDILYDSDSYVPAFYKGRALPSAGTTLHLETLARFKKRNGTFVPPSDIVYTWRRNGQVVGTVSGRGKSSASIPSPLLFSTDTISVEAESVDGIFSGTATIAVRSANPVIRLVEDHPLFGLRLNHSFTPSQSVVGKEIVVAAIPFFASAKTPTDTDLVYEWTVNGRRVDTKDVTRNELALGAQEGGVARIGLSVSHNTNIFFGADSRWTISFASETNANNPFQIR